MDPSPIHSPPVTSQPATQPAPSSSKIPSNIMIGILLLCIGFTAGLVFDKTTFFANPYINAKPTTTLTPAPTSDPTANWKTYINTKVGFEMKYPERYPQPGLPSGGPNSSPIYATGNEDNTDIIFGTSSLDSIDLDVFPFTGTVDQLKNDATKSPIAISEEKATLIKTIQVGETTAQWYATTPKIVYPNDTNSGAIRVYFIGNNHGFILNTTSNHNTEEIDQILSTFKFTDTTSTQQVQGIQLNSCCSCPTMVDVSQIGKNGWVAYEEGTDYTSQRPAACSVPNIGVCAPCPPPEGESTPSAFTPPSRCNAPPGTACL